MRRQIQLQSTQYVEITINLLLNNSVMDINKICKNMLNRLNVITINSLDAGNFDLTSMITF